MNKELQDKYLNLLKEIDKWDTENSHIAYDSILCDLLLELWYWDVVREYYESDKWYA